MIPIRIYQDLGDGFLLSRDPVDPEEREILVGLRRRQGAVPIAAAVTLTMERPSGRRYRIRLPQAGKTLARHLASCGRHEMVIPGAGVVRVEPGTNVGQVTSGPMQGVRVIF